MSFKTMKNSVLGFVKNTWNDLTGRSGVETAEKGNELVYQANKENIASQERINKANIDWAKQLNNIEMARSDNAHQREVADLHKSGLSAFSTMNGEEVGSLQAPNLTAPTNDVGSISSSMANLTAAQENRTNMLQGNIAHTMDYALGMLNFIKGEKELKHTKDYDNETLALAREQFNLQAKKETYSNYLTSLQAEYTKTQNDNAISHEVREKELHSLEVRMRALEVANQSAQNDALAIANNRSQLAYTNEQKEANYTDRMLEVRYNRECQDLAYTIAQTRSSGMDYVLKLKEKAQRDKDFELTEAEINKIAEELKIEKKRFTLDVWSEVIGDILGVGKIASDVVRTFKFSK